MICGSSAENVHIHALPLMHFGAKIIPLNGPLCVYKYMSVSVKELYACRAVIEEEIFIQGDCDGLNSEGVFSDEEMHAMDMLGVHLDV